MKKDLLNKTVFSKAWKILALILIVGGCKVSEQLTSESADSIPTNVFEDDWQSLLKTSFRQHYKTAVNAHSQSMHNKYPVITQDLLNMTLIRSNGEKVRFKMESKAYTTFAHTSHPPLTIYSILHPANFQVNNDSTLMKLKAYRTLLGDAKKGIKEAMHLKEQQKGRILNILTQSDNYIEQIISNKRTTREEYHTFAKSVRPLVEKNLYDGAMQQLTQFLKQLEDWKKAYPEEQWEELRVVILGFHQPRDMYTTKLFFQWLLKEPEIERRVVYAEFQFSIFGKNAAKATESALNLLTKVDLEKEVSLYLMGEETLLQKDVMGPSTARILQNWGETKWFLNEN